MSQHSDHCAGQAAASDVVGDFRFFDSSTYPTLNGKWLNGQRGMTFRELKTHATTWNVHRVLAAGLPNVGDYCHEDFKRQCDEFEFDAVAALTREASTTETLRELEHIKSLGYRGVKVHPRLMQANKSLRFLPTVFEAAASLNLVCLVCTYQYAPPGFLPEEDPLVAVNVALNRAPDVKLVLIHGGGIRLLEYAELARQSNRILLDLSFTVTRYWGSSLSLDISWILQVLDQRLCIGTDLPECTPSFFYRHLIEITRELSPSKRDNLLFANLERLFA